MRLYEESEHAHTSQVILDEFMHGGSRILNQAEYCMARDYLFTVIHFGNGHRSGVSANMLVDEFVKAKCASNVYIINVWNHKTVAYYGPAKVVLKPKHYEWLKVFVLKIRKQLPCRDENVFLSWTGKAQASGAISGRLHNLWVKVGIFDDVNSKRLSCNTIRKTCNTSLRETGSKRLQEAADLMAHSLQTAQTNYFMRKMEKAAVHGSEAIQSHFYATKTPPKKWSKEEEQHLERVFGKKREEGISLSEVKEMSPGCGINASPRQVYDKLRRTPIKRKLELQDNAMNKV